MTTSVDETISKLLGGAVELLDIPEDIRDQAVRRYEDVGNFLAENGGEGWSIYPQGSFRIGTPIKPPTSTGEYDIDLVCHNDIKKTSTTQEELKDRVGTMLDAYHEFKLVEDPDDAPELCVEGRRCWTLTYDGFHLDVLPAIPDEDAPPTSILLTDVKLRPWQYSNPIGYAEWFRGQSEEMRRGLEAKARAAGVAAVPDWAVRTTLQRLVQILKWHCYLHFMDDLGDRPPSVLITTLAAHAYCGETDLVTATLNAVSGMPRHIERVGNRWWVTNPAHDNENFADKWNEYPERRRKFLSWLNDLTATLNDAEGYAGKGLDRLVDRLGESFDLGLLRKSAQRMGLETQQFRNSRTLGMSRHTGALTVASGITVPKHNFYGTHTS
jgi:hypothetical protein